MQDHYNPPTVALEQEGYDKALIINTKRKRDALDYVDECQEWMLGSPNQKAPIKIHLYGFEQAHVLKFEDQDTLSSMPLQYIFQVGILLDEYWNTYFLRKAVLEDVEKSTDVG